MRTIAAKIIMNVIFERFGIKEQHLKARKDFIIANNTPKLGFDNVTSHILLILHLLVPLTSLGSFYFYVNQEFYLIRHTKHINKYSSRSTSNQCNVI